MRNLFRDGGLFESFFKLSGFPCDPCEHSATIVYLVYARQCLPFCLMRLDKEDEAELVAIVFVGGKRKEAGDYV